MSLREVFGYVTACVQPLSALTPDPNVQRDLQLVNYSNTNSPTFTPKTSAATTRKLSSINVDDVQQTQQSLRKLQVHSRLQIRDLRQLFSTNSASEPTIAVRRHVVLFNFETIRAVVLADRLILLVPNGADRELRDIERELNSEHEEPVDFELRAYETLLNVSSLSLARELKNIGT